MTALLNDPGSLPAPMWAVARFLLATSGDVSVADAQSLVSPASLQSSSGTDKTFRWAVDTLCMLGLASLDGGSITATSRLRRGSPKHMSTFAEMLRREVLAPARNGSLGDNGDQTQGRDLVRALCWFLTLDPLRGYAWQDVEQLQAGAFAPSVGVPFTNDFRWSRFVYWAPTLGFAAASLLADGRSTRLSPDCTAAVRATTLRSWNKGDHVPADQAISLLLEELPVLPGGRYSRALGLVPSTTTSASLSHALIRGHDEGWIRLEARSDAANDVTLVDPDIASGVRRVTDIGVLGAVR